MPTATSTPAPAASPVQINTGAGLTGINTAVQQCVQATNQLLTQATALVTATQGLVTQQTALVTATNNLVTQTTALVTQTAPSLSATI